MTCRVAVFSSESWSESVHVTHRLTKILHAELTTDCKERRLAEKILFVVDLALLEGDDLGFLLGFFLNWLVFGVCFTFLTLWLGSLALLLFL